MLRIKQLNRNCLCGKKIHFGKICQTTQIAPFTKENMWKLLMDFNKISDKFWGDPLDRDFTNKPCFHLQRTVAPWGKAHVLISKCK